MNNERLQIRVHGAPDLPTLIYLPGLHGDWTLIGGFRKAVLGRVRFVEMIYPRTLDWTLEQYAANIEAGLLEQGISSGWLLGESFGSQIVWPLVARKRLHVNAVILAGGFVRHPMLWGVRLAERIGEGMPLRLLTRILFSYAVVAKLRFRSQPDVLAGIDEFIARRTELDKRAATHRLRLIARNDPAGLAGCVDVPLYAITGMIDIIVPWFTVRRWLRNNCPQLREYRIIRRADHTVLSTGASEAAGQVLRWIGEARQAI